MLAALTFTFDFLQCFIFLVVDQWNLTLTLQLCWWLQWWQWWSQGPGKDEVCSNMTNGVVQDAII